MLDGNGGDMWRRCYLVVVVVVVVVMLFSACLLHFARLSARFNIKDNTGNKALKVNKK
jgi:hypothetical protein